MNLQSLLLQAPASGLNPQLINILFIGGMVLIFYFFMIRPQQQKQKKQKKFNEALKKGDKVVTIGGMHGTVYAVDDATIILEVDKSTRIKFDKASLSADNSELANK